MAESPGPDVPDSITRVAPNEIEILWSSGTRRRYAARMLRDACPCATCRERRRGDEDAATDRGARGRPLLPVLSSAEAKPLTIEAMQPVGNYAYNIEFGDGHSSGIYTLKMLRELGRPAEGSVQ